MRLKTIHVDGFKSYATPTVIGEFDASFNAITGLNGSGKSNILDAICFAMGITTLSSVRVANLQELIYKQGTAGITKASVTLTFDNSDKSQSPTGYESDREITVTRQIFVSNPTKYMINGRKALATEVSNMFRSVQLNVNNPHFLIMQGRITKVLNMKPEEIRDMLQEALGTLMYETKKLEAQKKMAQKDIKVTAIKETLDKQITPRIEKLREDKKEYDRYNAVVQDLQRHKRFIIAYDFYSKQEMGKQGRLQIVALADEIENQKTLKKQLAQDEKLALAKLEDKRKKRETEASGPLKLAVDEEKELGKILVQAAADRDGAQEEFKTESQVLLTNEQRKMELTTLLEICEQDAEHAHASVSQAQQSVVQQRAAAERARQGVESAETGSNDMLQDELLLAQKQEQEQSTQLQMCGMTIKTKQAERKKLQGEFDREVKQESKQSDLQQQIQHVQSKVDATKCNMAALPAAVAGAPSGNDAVRELELKAKQLRSNHANLTQFKFDSSCLANGGQCFGRLATLVRIKPDLVETHSKALEVSAGSKLYQIVVDSKETSSRILKHGKLQTRVTIVPLNAITMRIADSNKVSYAVKKASAAGGSAMLALEACVNESKETWQAMQYAFGNTLLCDSSRTAKLLAFDDKIRMRCVTLEGDVFDPSGTLTGGSRNTANGVAALSELSSLRALERALIEAREENQRLEQVEASRLALNRELGQQEHELQMLLTRNAECKSQRLQDEIKQLDQELSEAEQTKTKSQQLLEEAKSRIAELKDALQNTERGKQRLVAEAKKQELAAKKQLKQCEADYQQALKLVEQVENTKTTSQHELDELVQALQVQTQQVKQLETKALQCEKAFETSTRKFQQARQAREEVERSFRAFDTQIVDLEAQANKAAEAARKLDMELKQLDANQTKLRGEVKFADESVQSLKREHAWIDKEQQFFGKAHTEYDFEVKDPKQIADKYRELEAVQNTLARSINKKALAMMEKSEEEYDTLDLKRRTIENDRIAIERVIAGLDKKKNEALVEAYEKVNKDFGSIFSTLLPGARAELRPVENGTVLDGLEVRVAFGQTWKESLQELSGGQRSLLALSLVLALLRFKPAPLYILDEIDAALDLSHTQNIGVMLRTHFSESQFIVVSLKEGMFANASCLFRTKFVDGISTVTRTVNRNFNQRVSDVATTAQKSAMKKKRAVVEEEEEEENAH